MTPIHARFDEGALGIAACCGHGRRVRRSVREQLHVCTSVLLYPHFVNISDERQIMQLTLFSGSYSFFHIIGTMFGGICKSVVVKINADCSILSLSVLSDKTTYSLV